MLCSQPIEDTTDVNVLNRPTTILVPGILDMFLDTFDDLFPSSPPTPSSVHSLPHHIFGLIQEAGKALATPLESRECVCGDDHPLPSCSLSINSSESVRATRRTPYEGGVHRRPDGRRRPRTVKMEHVKKSGADRDGLIERVIEFTPVISHPACRRAGRDFARRPRPLALAPEDSRHYRITGSGAS
ncbi:hypothetical protein EVAR_93184_1 [Eumeta japonica]|uniref:Uncharacterized protein n=1 Tax=Eumeta variegata TaxID=151549 RepID=A0A4C1TYT4_EUMVA|nr:hypothetical protein EVAR_93184_1 [Eumeta japonica]